MSKLRCKCYKQSEQGEKGKNKQEKKPGKVEYKATLHNAEAEEAETDDTTTKMRNLGRINKLSSAEVFYMNEQDKCAKSLTCVGTVSIKSVQFVLLL